MLLNDNLPKSGKKMVLLLLLLMTKFSSSLLVRHITIPYGRKKSSSSQLRPSCHHSRRFLVDVNNMGTSIFGRTPTCYVGGGGFQNVNVINKTHQTKKHIHTMSMMSNANSIASSALSRISFDRNVLMLSIAVFGIVSIVSILLFVYWIVLTMHSSVGIDKPTPKQLQEQEQHHQSCALFRHYPDLKDRIAWKSLGDYPTPIHFCECQARPLTNSCTDDSSRSSVGNHSYPTVQFFVKREDLSSSMYGGNKVRTLEHQLAVIEAKLERSKDLLKGNNQYYHPKNQLFAIGSGGSNQIIATVVHAIKSHLPIQTITALWISDPPDLDNTLNMLSTLSFCSTDDDENENEQQGKIMVGSADGDIGGNSVRRKTNSKINVTFETWGKPFSLASTLISACLSSAARRLERGSKKGNIDDTFVLTLGGNSPSGVIGQISGAIELAEQIEQGALSKNATSTTIDGIYVAVGSSCTVSGLIIGVALARRCGMTAFNTESFKIHLVPIDGTLASVNRITGLYNKASFSRFIPLTARHSIHETCKVLYNLGGPDVLHDALQVLEQETVVHDDAELVGTYGVHSVPSLACAQLFDETAMLRECCDSVDSDNEVLPGMWLCGHFTAKVMAVLCDDLLKENAEKKTLVYWHTKSGIQPRKQDKRKTESKGNKGLIAEENEEWKQMKQMPTAVQDWANQGQAQSALRPGKVDLINGSPEDYQNLTTVVNLK